MLKAAPLDTNAGTTPGGLTLEVGPVPQLWDWDLGEDPVGKVWSEGVTRVLARGRLSTGKGTQ